MIFLFFFNSLTYALQVEELLQHRVHKGRFAGIQQPNKTARVRRPRSLRRRRLPLRKRHAALLHCGEHVHQPALEQHGQIFRTIGAKRHQQIKRGGGCCGLWGDVAGLTVGDPQLARRRHPILNQPGPGLGEGFPSPEHFQAPLAARRGPWAEGCSGHLGGVKLLSSAGSVSIFEASALRRV